MGTTTDKKGLSSDFSNHVKIIRSALIGEYRRWSAPVGVYRRGVIAKNGPVLDLVHENQNNQI
jgi:hypothetical protein